ncbi:DNA repair protein RecN [Sporosarcina thermotolerans]|uniref:DNA repair protein RecN n=1 Tax=Sporosarcina thermotolerans TaxID=633404 RepID=A0AAW9A8I6_9BACL|nr:DNA repair protein RecN [Sporosarcina thermotolerans]MDW0117305.1 DNA repair protein RecN [Sporosarcina thermotolerans]WHT47459.1 DNA repair protein RecN [Sporosarcina thermotolerans]
MLSELSIRNFAIIEQLEVSFEEGLTVLTGETGAGKSIIIDAIQLLVGGRGSQEFIRHGANKAELEGMFIIEEENHPVFEKLNDFGIDFEDGNIILRRDINSNGKTSCRVNGKLVTIASLREIGSQLIDIHGQHDNQELMHERRHIHLLDQFAGQPLFEAHKNYHDIYERYVKLKRRLETANENEQQVAQRIDLYSFQLKEIDAAGLQVGEEEELEEEKLKLQHFNRLFERLNTAFESIGGDNHALDWVGSAMSDLEDAASIDKELSSQAEIISSCFYSLQDVSHELKSIIDSMEFDPMRLSFVEDRLALLLSLKRKYGTTIEDILIYREKISDELDQLLNRDARIVEEQEKLDQLKKDLEIEANELSIIRKKSASVLEKAIMQQLKELHMEKSDFKVSVTRKPANVFDSNGIDDIVFLISTNVGEPLKQLVKIASGGELSRIMLALKTIFSKHQGITSIIFDEVDTGVSGRVAQAIADKISMIAVNSQVLCISHLPQVAAMADHHLLIKKEVTDNRTTTAVAEIFEIERTKELSRMLSGAEITSLTLQHAEELLSMAETRKATFH